MASSAYTISGQALKRMDATVRTLAAVEVTNARLVYNSMSADYLRFTMPAAPPVGGAPEAGQTVSIFRDGVRIFTGEVTRANHTITGRSRPAYNIEVSGGWYWLDQTLMTTTRADDAGGSKERPVVGLATGTIGAGAAAILARARALGSPLLDGTIDAGFEVPGMTFPNMSCGQALAELLRFHGAYVSRVDYTGSTQRLHLRTRGNATANTVDLDAVTVTPTAGSPVTLRLTSSNLTPRVQLRPTGVVIASSSRNVQGRLVYNEQTAGTAGPGNTRRRVLAVSGPELDTYLPKQDYESLAPVTTTSIMELSGVPLGARGTVWPFTGYTKPADLPTPTLIKEGGGSPSGTHYLLTPDALPDWFIREQNLTVERATWKGTCYTIIYKGPYKSTQPGYEGWYSYDTWDRAQPMGQEIGEWIDAGAQSFSYQFGVGYKFKAFFKVVSFPVLVLSKSYTGTTIYRAGDYAYATPPTGLAGNILAAQNFTPWEGRATFHGADTLLVPWAGRTLHMTGTGTEAAMATMGALVSSVTHNLFLGTAEVILGTPPRNSFESLVGGIRRTPQDNIVWLTNAP